MDIFQITILGCGSATPSTKHFTSSQIVNIRRKLFMVDCGEGTQIQLRRSKLPFNKVNRILISHLHGDHCFGLIGMISSFALLGRVNPLYIHAPEQLWSIFKPQLDFFCKNPGFEIEFHGFNPDKSITIFNDNSLSIITIPLIHRIPCAGFLFVEKPTPDHLNRAVADFHNVPVWDFERIKKGGDFITARGEIIPHSVLTHPSAPPRKYAYCCDTAYNPGMANIIKDVNLLYHDSTYIDLDSSKAKAHSHSTSGDAARIAAMVNAKKLVLGHFSARYKNENVFLKEAMNIFPNTILANENLVIPVE